MEQLIVRFAEIGLKGKNRPLFERQLADNIRRSLGLDNGQVKRDTNAAQLLVKVPPQRLEEARDMLARVFGIAWFAHAQRCRANLDEIVRVGAALADGVIGTEDSFAVRASRSHKKLAFTSMDVEIQLGDAVRIASGATVNLEHPDKELYVYVGSKYAYLSVEKIPGSGGLPVGTSSKVLSLISGGFDSIAASHRLAKRGACVDFLHFHVYPDGSYVADSKMPRIWARLGAYTLSRRIFLASDFIFQMAIAGFNKQEARYEQVIFRRMMVRVGQQLADKHGYHAMVLGDSLGQVASQTMENMTMLDRVAEVPLLRPLIGMDKQEVINEVAAIGLRAEASESYRDCCSILSTASPVIAANLDRLEYLEEKLGIDQIVEQTLDKVEVQQLNGH